VVFFDTSPCAALDRVGNPDKSLPGLVDDGSMPELPRGEAVRIEHHIVDGRGGETVSRFAAWLLDELGDDPDSKDAKENPIEIMLIIALLSSFLGLVREQDDFAVGGPRFQLEAVAFAVLDGPCGTNLGELRFVIFGCFVVVSHECFV
jgi:hypothetical protein